MVKLAKEKIFCNLSISVQELDFDIQYEIDNIKRRKKNFGGLASFLGQVRDSAENDKTLLFLELEHYPDMTEKEITSICNDALGKWELHDIRVIHRVGKLIPGDNIVLVLATSSHREEAFKAVEFIMDFLKSRVPIWKKEHYENNSSWVKSKKSDEELLSRW